MIIDVRELDVRPLRQREPHPSGERRVPVAAADPRGAVAALPAEDGGIAEREERGEGQHFVVDRQPAAEGPAAPRQQRAHRVCAAERRAGHRDELAVLPLQVDAHGPHFLRDPRVERGERQRVRRSPEALLVLAGGREKKHPRAEPELFVAGVRMQIREAFRDAHPPPAVPSRLAAQQALRVNVEEARGRPISAQLQRRERAIAPLVDAGPARIQPPEPMLQPRRLPLGPHAARGQESGEHERRLRACRKRDQREPQPHRHNAIRGSRHSPTSCRP